VGRWFGWLRWKWALAVDRLLHLVPNECDDPGPE